MTTAQLTLPVASPDEADVDLHIRRYRAFLRDDHQVQLVVSAAFRAVEMGRITEALLDALDGVRWDETDQRWVGYLSVNRMRAKEPPHA